MKHYVCASLVEMLELCHAYVNSKDVLAQEASHY